MAKASQLPSILAFSPGTWRWPEVYGSPRYHLWTLAEMGWRVLYVEPPNQLRAMTKVWKAKDREFYVLSPGRVAPFGIRMVKSEKMGERWRRLTSRQLAKRALSAAAGLRMNPSAYWFGAPWHESILAELPEGPARAVHVYDELSLSPALDEEQRRLLWEWERMLLREADVAFCSSMPQLQRRHGIPKRVVLLENAVPETFFPEHLSLSPPPAIAALEERMKALAPPVFAYGGTADHRLEPAFFTSLLESIPVGSLAFLGRLDPSADPEIKSMIKDHRNVHSFGEVPYSAYPYLYRHASVLLIAHKRTPFTDAMFPEKLNEYLASGKPVVAVAIPEVGRVARETTFRDMIRTVDSPLEFVDACTVAMGDQDPLVAEARIENARSRTWQAAGRRLHEELQRALPQAGK